MIALGGEGDIHPDLQDLYELSFQAPLALVWL